jgi:amino acid transporter
MTRTRPGPLVALAVIGTVVGFLLQIALAAASLPKLRVEYTFAVTIGLIALVIVILAVPVYRATHGPLRRPVDSFYATRVLALAKASSLAGALLVGLGLGLALDLLVRSSTTTGDLVARDLSTLGSAILLLAAGLVAEFLCRVPPQDDDDDHSDRGPERVHL